MTARKRLDEMKQFIKIAEGAWSLPRSKQDFDSLAATLNSKEPNIKIQDMLYNILGDDDLFDRLDGLDPQGFDAPKTIIQWMKDQRKNPYSNFPNIWNTFQLSQREDSPMNEDEDEGIKFDYYGIKYDGVTYSRSRVPIKYYEQFKAEYPGARVRFRGPKRGKQNTSLTDATHFYIVSTKKIDRMNVDDFGPAAQGKSDIIRKWGAEQSKEVTDLSLPNDEKELDEEEPTEEFKNTLVNPQWKERRAAEIQKRKDWLRRTYQSGDRIPDDLHMARVKTPKGTGTVYSIHNYEPSEAHDYPTVSVRLDNDPGGYGGGKLQYIFKLSDVEILLDEVGDVKFDDYGAVDEDQKFRVRPNDPWMPDTLVPDEFKRDGRVMKRRKGYQNWLQAEKDKFNTDMFENIELNDVVENVLQEYPGQPKDYNDDEKFEREQAKRSKHIQDQAREFERDTIDPEISDDELGYRFD